MAETHAVCESEANQPITIPVSSKLAGLHWSSRIRVKKVQTSLPTYLYLINEVLNTRIYIYKEMNYCENAKAFYFPRFVLKESLMPVIMILCQINYNDLLKA